MLLLCRSEATREAKGERGSRLVKRSAGPWFSSHRGHSKYTPIELGVALVQFWEIFLTYTRTLATIRDASLSKRSLPFAAPPSSPRDFLSRHPTFLESSSSCS